MATVAALGTSAPPVVRFSTAGEFHLDLKRQVAAHFAATGRSPYGGARMVLKTTVLFAWAGASYAALLLADVAAWQRGLLAASLGLAMAGIGFGVMHDANHGSYARGRRANHVVGFALDLIGGSSWLWRFKHNVLHHTYTNVSGIDTDLDANALLRFAPDQPWRPVMRFQHLYVWALYAVYPLGWWFIDDFRRLLRGRIGTSPIPRPRRRDVAALLAGKAVFYAWAVVVPLAVHPTWRVLPFAAITVATLGITLALTFQLAHCVQEAEFHRADVPAPPADWATHQVRTTVDFCRGNRLLSWYLGGLNFQVVHHLFPKVSHVHYPALSRIVESACAAHGIRYTVQPSLAAAIGANVRWLRALGQGAPAVTAPAAAGTRALAAAGRPLPTR